MENNKSNNSSIVGFEGLEKEVRVANNYKRSGVESCEFVMRFLGLVLTLSAAVILGVNKQTKIIPIKILDTLPPINLSVTAKWHYLSAFTYFVVANAIACSYAAISLVLSLAKRGRKSGNLGLVIVLVDMVMTGLLFSSNGAAAAIGLVGYEGNSHLQWNKVCNVFNKFCDQGAAALVFSLLGAFAFLLLVMLAIKRLHCK